MIGVAMTRHNRRELGDRAVRHWRKHLPAGAVLHIVDDASDPVVESTFRFDENVGIAAAKNRCIELLMSAGCQHLFLVDDDVWPIVPDWWKPYIESPYAHLVYRHPRFTKVMWERDGHIRARRPMGGMQYVTRHVIEVVGGMRLEFGRYGYEHVEWSNRIRDAGLVPETGIDVAGSQNLWHWDHRREPSSVPEAWRKQQLKKMRELRDHYLGSTDFVPYREGLQTCSQQSSS